MKRRLFFCMVALVAGIYAAYFIPGLISVLFLALLGFSLLVLSICKKPVVPYLLMVLCFLFGAFYLQSAEKIEKRPLYPYINEYVTIYGDVTEDVLKNEKDGSQTVLARINHLSFLKDEIDAEENIRLTVPAGEPELAFGDSFTAICLLSKPASLQNSGGFDYKLYLMSKEIFFTGRIEKGTLEKTGTFSLSLSERLYQLNRKCGQAICNALPKEPAALLKAVALGDKSAMSDELKKDLSVSGLSHMTAVSGMHVTTLLSFVYIILSLLKRNKYKFFLPVCGVILLFMLFTGATPSVVRASLMSVLALVAYVLYRKEDGFTSLGLSAGIIAVLNPFSVFDAGFMLSFGATLGILLFATPLQNRLLAWFHLKDRKGFWLKALQAVFALFSVTLSAQLFLLPIVSLLQGNVSLWCFITNILAAPLLPVLLVGGLLIGFLGLLHPWAGFPVCGFVYPFIKLFLLVVHFFGKLDFGVVTIGTFSLLGFYIFGLFLLSFHSLLKKKYWRMFISGVCVPVLLFSMLIVYPLFPRAQVTFINVGQGDCALIKLPNGITTLIDGGGVEYAPDYDVGREVVLPYLKKEGVRKLTYMVATHPHADHIGGLSSVMEEMRVDTLLIPSGFTETEEGKAFAEKAKSLGISVEVLSSGDVISLGKDSRFEVLMPDAISLEQAEEENDISLVFRFCYGENSVLFTGDMAETGEEHLTNLYPEGKPADIIKAGHHGSAGATSEALLKWAKPKYAYIPCGKNHFGHPAKEVLGRLSDHGVTVFRADEDLDVTFILNRREIQAIKKGGKAR